MTNEHIVVPALQLTEDEQRSTVWLKISAYLTTRIEEHRTKNDADLDAVKTANLRGRIAEAQNLLALGNAKD